MSMTHSPDGFIYINPDPQDPRDVAIREALALHYNDGTGSNDCMCCGWESGWPCATTEALMKSGVVMPPAAEVDPLAHIEVGDPDPLPDLDDVCPVTWEDATRDDDLQEWSCSRESGHPGQHIAGDVHRVVVAVHPASPQTSRAASGRHAR